MLWEEKNSDAHVSGGEHREEIVHGLVEAGVSDHDIGFMLFLQKRNHTDEAKQDGKPRMGPRLLALELQQEKVGDWSYQWRAWQPA